MAFSSKGIDPLIEQVYNETGMYVLGASDNENLLDNYLGHDVTVIQNIHAPGQVWNYPIFRKTTRYHDLSAGEIASSSVPLPSYLFQDRSGGANSDLLKAYALAEKGLKIYEDQEFPETHVSEAGRRKAEKSLEGSESERAALREQAFAFAGRAGISPGSIPLEPIVEGSGSSGTRAAPNRSDQAPARAQDPLLGLFRELYRRIGRKVEAGRIGISPAYQVQDAKTRVEFAVESPFAKNLTRTRDSATEYYLIRPRGASRYSDSRWVTPVRGRPQSVWVAGSFARPGSGNPYASVYGLGDLYEMLGSCTNINDVRGFFEDLRAFLRSPRVDPIQWSRLRAEYARLKGVVNQDEVKRELSSSRVPGVSWRALIAPR